MVSDAPERAAVVACARQWLRTPYHHRGRVKGAGVDCAMLLAEVYAEAGLVAPLAIPHYPPDWHLHRDAERYLGVLLDHAVEYVPVDAIPQGEAIRAGALRRPHPEPRTSPLRRFAPQAEVRESKDAPRDDGESVALHPPPIPSASRGACAYQASARTLGPNMPGGMFGGATGGGELLTRAILPGDIALWRFGRCFSHGAIVVDWPVVIHAYLGRPCVLEDAAKAVWLSHVGESGEAGNRPRPRRFFSYWGREG